MVERQRRLLLRMSPAWRLGLCAAMAALALATTWVVYATGGAKYSFLHLMYVPIVVAALAFDVPGGIAAGIVCGLLIGPYMPVNVVTGEMQETSNWVYRMVAFTLIGGLVGTGTQMLREHLRTLAWLHEHHEDTGLLNLPGLSRELDLMMAAARSDEKLVVSVTQFSNFLEIQNTFGTAFGARLLAMVVERARGVVPPGSLIALIQPDRLVTVVRGEQAAREVRFRAEAAMNESYVLDGVPVHVDVNIGVAHFPTHARSVEELVQKASIAMHWATASKSPISLYDGTNDRTNRENLILLGRLPEAITRSELRMWHQAKLSLAKGEIAGTEALLRWIHPDRGTVPPGAFVPQLEETTLINPITQWIIGSACADAARWRTNGYHLRVAINLSVRNLRDRMLLDVLDKSTRQNGLEPKDVELEITEGAVMSDPGSGIRLIAQLRERGYYVSIDDFGTGHSSLGYLQNLKVSGLKIDQGFVKTLVQDVHNQKIVQSLIHLAKALELETVAEGVEDMAAAELLARWGCDYAQGYAIHRPAPSDDLVRWLDSRKA